jgi:hypothetical protein
MKDKDILVSKVRYRNASKHKGITFHRRHNTTPQQNFCKLKIRTVVTEEGTRVQLFCIIWKRASIVYDHTALCYDGAVHHNVTVCRLGAEKNKR